MGGGHRLAPDLVRLRRRDGTPVGVYGGVGTHATGQVVAAAAAIPVDPVTPHDVAALIGCAATTGVGLLATKATEYVGNPFLLIKFPAIALGLINAAVVRVTPAWRAHVTRDLTAGEERQLALLGGVSLLCWLTAITAGRMIAYW
jgi:hypothetical protein